MDTVSLLTDFKPSDGFIGSMKGVILRIHPTATIIDLAHEVRKFSIQQGAFVLETSYQYFPEKTVFCVVIDPGVGTERRVIGVKTKKYFFIGPDNGVLYSIIRKPTTQEIREVTNEELFLPNVSHTFHGRDIFAPVAAYISKKETQFNKIGHQISVDSLKKVKLYDFHITNTKAKGKILMVDAFGNAITNIPRNDFWGEIGETYKIKLDDSILNARFVKAFGDAKGEILLLEENHGFLQISLREDSASEKLGLKVGDKITIKMSRS